MNTSSTATTTTQGRSNKVGPPLVTPSKWVWSRHAIELLERARWPQVVGHDLGAKLKVPAPNYRLTYVVERLLRGLASKSLRAVRHDVSMPAEQAVSIFPDSNHWLRAAGLEELQDGGTCEQGGCGRSYYLLLLERHVDEIALELVEEAQEERRLSGDVEAFGSSLEAQPSKELSPTSEPIVAGHTDKKSASGEKQLRAWAVSQVTANLKDPTFSKGDLMKIATGDLSVDDRAYLLKEHPDVPIGRVSKKGAQRIWDYVANFSHAGAWKAPGPKRGMRLQGKDQE